jgi:hypothetical protein
MASSGLIWISCLLFGWLLPFAITTAVNKHVKWHHNPHPSMSMICIQPLQPVKFFSKVGVSSDGLIMHVSAWLKPAA